MPVPASPRIYHITHVDNLPAIIAVDELLSDARVIASGTGPTSIGMSKIKKRRLALPVDGHPGLLVGGCVPFYFGPRSVMLYLIHQANHPELTYRGGQGPIVHLEADLGRSVAWLGAHRRRWAFSLSNAGARAAEFRVSLADLGDLDWDAIQNRDFREREVRERKQAELLAEDGFPWSLIERIGVRSRDVATRVHGILASAAHRPPVVIEPGWYY